MKFKHKEGLLVFCVVLVAAVLLFSEHVRPDETANKDKTFHQIMAAGYYVRETEDRDWNILIRGKIPSFRGAYIIILNVDGKIIHQAVIPHGDYTAEKPFKMRSARSLINAWKERAPSKKIRWRSDSLSPRYAPSDWCSASPSARRRGETRPHSP